MDVKVQQHKGAITSELMQLLLSADPDRNAVLGYLESVTLLAATFAEDIVGVAAFTVSGAEAELKNLAVLQSHQGRGIAKRLVSEVACGARAAGARVLTVGTGNSSLYRLGFYQKCGLRISGVVPDFFASYPEPIYENGIRCLDMIRLRLTL